jgi:hypothetical protein
MNAAQTQARVDAIVTQIAYAQAHGARAVLDEAIRNAGHLPHAVQDALVEARQSAAKAEADAKALGALLEAVRVDENGQDAPFTAVALVTVTA